MQIRRFSKSLNSKMILKKFLRHLGNLGILVKRSSRIILTKFTNLLKLHIRGFLRLLILNILFTKFLEHLENLEILVKRSSPIISTKNYTSAQTADTKVFEVADLEYRINQIPGSSGEPRNPGLNIISSFFDEKLQICSNYRNNGFWGHCSCISYWKNSWITWRTQEFWSKYHVLKFFQHNFTNLPKPQKQGFFKSLISNIVFCQNSTLFWINFFHKTSLIFFLMCTLYVTFKISMLSFFIFVTALFNLEIQVPAAVKRKKKKSNPHFLKKFHINSCIHAQQLFAGTSRK